MVAAVVALLLVGLALNTRLHAVFAYDVFRAAASKLCTAVLLLAYSCDQMLEYSCYILVFGAVSTLRCCIAVPVFHLCVRVTNHYECRFVTCSAIACILLLRTAHKQTCDIWCWAYTVLAHGEHFYRLEVTRYIKTVTVSNCLVSNTTMLCTATVHNCDVRYKLVCQ
jgi:hypothetical protein